MKNVKLFIFIAMLLQANCMQAQKGNFLVNAVKAVGRFVDSMSVRGVDRSYIEAPTRPWQFIVNYNPNQIEQKMDTHFPDLLDDLSVDFSVRFKTPVSNTVGVWLGYRGYGIGHSVNIGRHSGSLFRIGATGGSYGINMRLRTYDSATPELHLNMDYMGEKYNEYGRAELEEPIRVRSLTIDGYYMFNGRHFSYAAAYDQAVIQRRSAGSLMVGGMWHNTTIRANSDKNAELVAIMRNIGTIKVRQGSIGVGYAYNWVPVRNLLVNAMAMPMITFYNKQKLDFFDVYMDEDDNSDNNSVEYSHSVYHKSDVTVTFNAKMSVVYNWKNCFASVRGQWNRHRYDHDEHGGGSITEWYVDTSVGIRF